MHSVCFSPKKELETREMVNMEVRLRMDNQPGRRLGGVDTQHMDRIAKQRAGQQNRAGPSLPKKGDAF
jgi:hypothetical protein